MISSSCLRTARPSHQSHNRLPRLYRQRTPRQSNAQIILRIHRQIPLRIPPHPACHYTDRHH